MTMKASELADLDTDELAARVLTVMHQRERDEERERQ
jgi:ribosomal protein L29